MKGGDRRKPGDEGGEIRGVGALPTYVGGQSADSDPDAAIARLAARQHGVVSVPSSMRPAFTSGVAYAESSLGGCIAFTAGSSLSGTQD